MMILLMKGLIDNAGVDDVNEGLREMSDDVLESFDSLCLFFPFSDDADAWP